MAALKNPIRRGAAEASQPKRAIEEEHSARPLERDFITLPSRRLLLCTVPKAANISFKILAEAVNAQPRCMNMISRDAALRLSQDPSWWALGIVRNPWDRLVSCWHDKLVETDYPQFARFGWERGRVSFEAFVRDLVRIPYSEADKHFRAQHAFHHGIANQVIRLEDLEQTWPALAKKFGLPPLQHRNRTKGRPHDYRSLYSADLARQVALCYRVDIQLYGYRF